MRGYTGHRIFLVLMVIAFAATSCSVKEATPEEDSASKVISRKVNQLKRRADSLKVAILEYPDSQPSIIHTPLDRMDIVISNSYNVRSKNVLKGGKNKWTGRIVRKDSMPDGDGVLLVGTPMALDGTVVKSGYRIEGRFEDGAMSEWHIYDEKGNLIRELFD